LSLYVEGYSGVYLEPFSDLKEVRKSEVPGLTIANPNASVFVAPGATFEKVQITGVGRAFVYLGTDSVLKNCDIACHAKHSIFAAGFNCRLEGLFTHIYATVGMVVLGPGTTSQAGCNFCVQENSYILVGHDGMLSTNVFMRTSDSHGIYDGETRRRINDARPIILHPHVWVSRAATLNKGTEIGRGSVLGQGAVANGRLSPGCIYSGAPASLARSNIVWDRRSDQSLANDHNAAGSHFMPSFKANCVARKARIDTTSGEFWSRVTETSDHTLNEQLSMIAEGILTGCTVQGDEVTPASL
jgi:acetyltransferase-like isoleucine patch superfamily enzyme